MKDKKYGSRSYNGNRPNNSGNSSNRGPRPDQRIFAPFNFVPLNHNVFFPPYADLISQDVPFKDQVSGSITVTLTAKSPVFTKDSASDQLDGTFCCIHDGKSNTFFIPATSVKGCIRSVLEAMSFGKMSAVGNDRFETKDFRTNKNLTVHKVIPGNLLNPKGKEKYRPDLSECIFGYTFEGKSLRGRVQFGHAMAVEGTARVDSKLKAFQAYGPHPSYYPIYSQDGNKWDVEGTVIKGRKRYLIQNVDPLKQIEDAVKPTKKKSNDKDSATAYAKFLKEGTKFSLTVRFHNLRPFELGALLSAMTFHGNHDSCMHNIGFGKPYGYGKMSVSEISLNIREYDTQKVQNDWAYYINEFEKLMDGFRSDWRHSPQMTELLAIAGGWKKYEGYMSMPEYRKAKNNRSDKSMKLFSQLHTDCFRISEHAIVSLAPTHSPENSVTQKTANPAKKPQPTEKFEIGQEVTGICMKVGTVKINRSDSTATIVGDTKNINLNKLLFKSLKVRISRITPNGLITQVSFISVL